MKILDKCYKKYIKYAKEDIELLVCDYYLEDELNIKFIDKIKIYLYKKNVELNDYLFTKYNNVSDFDLSSSFYQYLIK